MGRTTLRLLTTLLAAILLGVLATQVLLLPWLASVMAQDAPEFAGLRRPVLALAVLVLACVEVALVAVWRLLGRIGDERIFSPTSTRPVMAITAAVVTATVLVAALTWVLSSAGAMPPLLFLILVAATVCGTALTLLMVVLRRLLLTATHDRTELAEVI